MDGRTTGSAMRLAPNGSGNGGKTEAPEVWPPRAKGPLWKGSRTATRKAKLADRNELRIKERDAKKEAKRRDHHQCRFPLCGCRQLGLRLDARLESSHHRHKGMGGDPSGARSIPALLVTLCKHRHQDGKISRHAGTLRPQFLTSQGFDGIIAWEVDVNAMRPSLAGSRAVWVEVGRELKIGTWATFKPTQLVYLHKLAEMDL